MPYENDPDEFADEVSRNLERRFGEVGGARKYGRRPADSAAAQTPAQSDPANGDPRTEYSDERGGYSRPDYTARSGSARSSPASGAADGYPETPRQPGRAESAAYGGSSARNGAAQGRAAYIRTDSGENALRRESAAAAERSTARNYGTARAAYGRAYGDASYGNGVPDRSGGGGGRGGYNGGAYPPRNGRRKKKHHGCLNFLLVLLVIAAIGYAAWSLMGKQPVRKTSGLGERKAGVSTILVAGTDDGGYRTDTILLVSIDSEKHTVSLLSIPRDTYVDGYSVPKINSACGAGGGGAEGMEELMKRVKQVLGFSPDGYAMVDLNAFIKIVDTMGGVDFDVPIDMDYDDPAQNLSIHFKAGMQHLDGTESMEVVRFRHDYARADLRRVEVQRDFVQAALKQWLKPWNIVKLPKLVSILKADVVTDLTNDNVFWCVKNLMRCKMSEITTETLPGEAQMIKGGSYFVADEDATAALMTESYSPYAS